MVDLSKQRTTGEQGYSWWFFSFSRSGRLSCLVAVVVLSLVGAFATWCNWAGIDTAPDSIVGMAYALTGTTCIGLSAGLYLLRRRQHVRAIGGLHTALNWHVTLATIGFIILLLHASGNFNSRTGTYALYGLIALVASGIIGRLIDRLFPWFITLASLQSLTVQGEDRIEELAEHFCGGTAAHAAGIGSVIGEGAATIPDVWPAQAQQPFAVLQRTQRAMQRKVCSRFVIRYWRLVHTILAVLTLALIIWHIVYALQLLLH